MPAPLQSARSHSPVEKSARLTLLSKFGCLEDLLVEARPKDQKSLQVKKDLLMPEAVNPRPRHVSDSDRAR